MLNFFYGTMFAGKTLHLIQAKEIYNLKGINAVVLKKDTDTREAHADYGRVWENCRPLRKDEVTFYEDKK